MQLKIQTKEEIGIAIAILIELALLAKAIYSLEAYCPTATVECTNYRYHFGPFFWIVLGALVITIALGVFLWFWNKRKNNYK